jgi:hypothetical protein
LQQLASMYGSLSKTLFFPLGVVLNVMTPFEFSKAHR